MKTFVICCILALSAWTEATDYCAQSTLLCPSGKAHITCNNAKDFALACGKYPSIISLNDDQKYSVIDFLNSFRDEVASGTVASNGNQPAARMSTLQWDDELATIAEYNSRKCDAKIDTECHNTCLYPYTGQILALNSYSWSSTYGPNIKNALSRATENYKANSSSPAGNVMITDYYTHVGCAAILSWLNGEWRFQVTCNYGTTSNKAERYTVGPAASLCTTGTNPVHSSLCSPKESFGGAAVC